MDSMPKEYDATLFAETSMYYSKYRLGYPVDLFSEVYHQASLGPDSIILDLGCGTGNVAFGFADKKVTVYAVDPDPDMIAEGVRLASQNNISSIRWLVGTDKQVANMKLPQLSACTMGASFHWTDRPSLLKQLDQMITPGGCVVIFSGHFDMNHLETALWNKLASEVIKEFLGHKRRAGKGIYMHPQKRHREVLAESPFNCVKTSYFKKRFFLTVEHIIGLQLSMSFASPAQLGEKLTMFKSVLAERLATATEKTVFESVMKYELIIAKR